ncbi:hypothetical protein BC628DRAFT_1417438 [Trametes gibbosa]|nr:hypothetical protein BC628DRAFT_1417438 [Trametes gibbosa]
MSDLTLDLYSLLLFVLHAFCSYIFNRPIRGQHLQVGRLSLSSIHDIHYAGTLYSKSYSFTYTTSSITWRFHLPRRTDPRWLTITVGDILYSSSSSDISTTKIEVILWFFPVLFRFTAGPWANVSVDGLRIKVQKSTATPYWIQQMRANLVSTFLTGDFLRADVFRTAIRFAGLSDHADNKPAGDTDPRTQLVSSVQPEAEADEEEEHCGCCSPSSTDKSNGYTTYAHQEEADAFAGADTYKTGPLRTGDEDEVRFNALARRVHINNTEGRMYTFGRIDSQMRRNWAADKGSFAMIAEECRWVRVHCPYERFAPRAWYTQVLSSLLHFPWDFFRTMSDPSSGMNLYVTRVDVTFESFRLRDAELVRQGVALAHAKAITSNINWSDAFFDGLANAFAHQNSEISL